MKTPIIKALVPYFGSGRMVAKRVGELFKGINWLGVPMAGSCSEILYIKARTIVCNDLNFDVINLARVVADGSKCVELIDIVNSKLFSQAELKSAQAGDIKYSADEQVDAAARYFIKCWMGRSGLAGTDQENTGSLAVRWESAGGDSALRWRSAVNSLGAWRSHLKRCSFLVMDAFDFIDKCHDSVDHGLYCDAPWVSDGDDYKHKFSLEDHVKLSMRLDEFKFTKIVVRYGDCPGVRQLYDDGWCYRSVDGRTQANNIKKEVLITKNISF